jgi:hypothetical protein
MTILLHQKMYLHRKRQLLPIQIFVELERKFRCELDYKTEKNEITKLPKKTIEMFSIVI